MNDVVSGDWTEEEVMKFLNISKWQIRMINKRGAIPRIPYSKRTFRYAKADVLHFRESLRTGGWLEKEKAA